MCTMCNFVDVTHGVTSWEQLISCFSSLSFPFVTTSAKMYMAALVYVVLLLKRKFKTIGV